MLKALCGVFPMTCVAAEFLLACHRDKSVAYGKVLHTLTPLHAALKRHRGSPPLSPNQPPQVEGSPHIPYCRSHSAPTQGSLHLGGLQGPDLPQELLPQGRLQQLLSERGLLPASGPRTTSQQQAWPEGWSEDAWGALGGSGMGGTLLGRPAAAAVEVAQSLPYLGSALRAGAGTQGQFHGVARPLSGLIKLSTLCSTLTVHQHALLLSTLCASYGHMMPASSATYCTECTATSHTSKKLPPTRSIAKQNKLTTSLEH